MWRDTRHPDGGGSEIYVERIAEWLAAQGHKVTIVCAEHANAARDEVFHGVRFHRRGGRLSVYLRGAWFLLGREARQADVVVDVQNGLPFLSPLVRRKPIVVLVHHVHREQWQIIYPGVPGRLGWWFESRVSPRIYRNHDYVTVSSSSADDLAALGVPTNRIVVIHNGVDDPRAPVRAARSSTPMLCAVGRLVPHKQIEHALIVLASLREEIPDLSLEIVGDGWWRRNLELEAHRLGVEEHVVFHGHVDDASRDLVLDRSWALLAPSVKEGWGIAIMEAAAHGVPAMAYRSAGGVRESVLDGCTGVLADDLAGLIAATRLVLTDRTVRDRMAAAARRRAADFDWPSSAAKMSQLLRHAAELDQRLP